jgi:hypothetical protein
MYIIFWILSIWNELSMTKLDNLIMEISFPLFQQEISLEEATLPVIIFSHFLVGFQYAFKFLKKLSTYI